MSLKININKELSLFVNKLPDTYIVGGYIRDIILGRHTVDIDMCCKDISLCLKEIDKMGINYYQKNSQYPIYFFSYKGFLIDLSEFRTDKLPSGRHTTIEKTESIYSDAERRDLSCNSIYVNGLGEMYDPFNGLSDIRKGVCKFIINKYGRLIEDHLRIYRYIRFKLLFALIKGKNIGSISCNIKPLTIRQMVKKVSTDRVVQELKKILSYFIEYNYPINIDFLNRILYLLKPFGIKSIDSKVVGFINLNKNYIYPRVKCLYSLIFNFSNTLIQTKLIKYIKSPESPIIDYFNNVPGHFVLQKLIKKCRLTSYKFYLKKIVFNTKRAKILEQHKDKQDIKFHMQNLLNEFSQQ